MNFQIKFDKILNIFKGYICILRYNVIDHINITFKEILILIIDNLLKQSREVGDNSYKNI